jgi:hypothetical protein
MFRNKDSFSQWGVVSPSPSPQAGVPPLVGCPRLLIQYIHSYPPYGRPSLHPQPEDAPWQGPTYSMECLRTSLKYCSQFRVCSITIQCLSVRNFVSIKLRGWVSCSIQSRRRPISCFVAFCPSVWYSSNLVLYTGITLCQTHCCMWIRTEMFGQLASSVVSDVMISFRFRPLD